MTNEENVQAYFTAVKQMRDGENMVTEGQAMIDAANAAKPNLSLKKYTCKKPSGDVIPNLALMGKVPAEGPETWPWDFQADENGLLELPVGLTAKLDAPDLQQVQVNVTDTTDADLVFCENS